MAAPDLGTTEWERSKISNQDINLMKKLGLMKKKEAMRFPSEESYPTPPIEYWVSFVDHLIRGLSTPIHDFLRASSEKEAESEASESTHSLPSAVSPRNKRKRDDAANSGTSKTNKSTLEETLPEEEDKPLNPYEDALVKSFSEANKRAGDLARKLEQSEKDHEKAESDAAAVEGLQKRLQNTENALSENITQQFAREQEIITRLESQSQHFLIFDNYTVVPRSSDALPAASFSKKSSAVEFIEGSSSAAQNEDWNDLRQQLQSMKKQALVIMEQSRKSSEREKLALQQAQEALALKETAVTEAAEASSRENYMLQLMSDSSLDMTAEEMMDELLRKDAEFFVRGSYAEHRTGAANNERINIDDILGSD
nr:uncharacterized protein LOC127347856 [Lolium perenne]